MGGAQRGNRKRKQVTNQGARAVAAARGTNTDRNRIIIGVVVVVVLAAAVVGGVLYQQSRASAAANASIPALTVAGSDKYPVQVDKASATVLVGKPTAKITIDTYEDFLCPFCGQFEHANFSAMESQLEAGTIKVRYHIINLLDTHSVPSGYSLMSANAALAVATVAPGKFMDFHYSLYQDQPAENGPGWTQTQLVSLANRLGVSGIGFTNLVNNKTYDSQIQNALNADVNNHALWQQNPNASGFGTPTVVANGVVQNVSDYTTNWLNALLKA
jgi:protein-disulfide isomerase